MELHKKEKIPLYFKNLNEDENILIGNGLLDNNKNNYKFSNQKTSQQTNYKYSSKDFTFYDKTNPDSLYKGREVNQDSCYILMEYRQTIKKFIIYPANKWVNFKKSFNYKYENLNIQMPQKKDPSTSANDKKKIEQNDILNAIELKIKQKKKESAEINKLFKCDIYSKIKSEAGKKRSTTQKISKRVIKNNEENNEENLDEENLDFDFDEDSHSSEKDPNLDDSDESIKEENSVNKNKKEENTNNKQKEEDSLEDEDYNFEDSYSSEVDEKKMDKDDELFGHLNPSKSNSLDKNSDLLNKKRERSEKGNNDLKVSLINLLAKNNRMTYEEIFEGLNKEYSPNVIQENIDGLLNECTNKYTDKGETYYFRK